MKKYLKTIVAVLMVVYFVLLCVFHDLAQLGEKDDWTESEGRRVDVYMRSVGYMTKIIPPIGILQGMNYASKTGFAYLDGTLPEASFMSFWRELVMYSPGEKDGDSLK